MRKELFIRPSPHKFTPPGELQIGWRFTDEADVTVELPWGSVGFGRDKDAQERRLREIIVELRRQQAALGNADFTIADHRTQ